MAPGGLLVGMMRGGMLTAEELIRITDAFWERHPPRAVRPPIAVPNMVDPPQPLVVPYRGLLYALPQFLSRPKGSRDLAYDTIAALEEGRIDLEDVDPSLFDEREREQFLHWLHTHEPPEQDLKNRRVSVSPLPNTGYPPLIQRCTYMILLDTGWLRLPPGAVVHHRDGKSMNDALENLLPLPIRVHRGLHRLRSVGHSAEADAVEGYAATLMRTLKHRHAWWAAAGAVP